MIFTETKLKGAFVIDIERREDSRGYFARAFCQHEFEAHGLKPTIAQANLENRHERPPTHALFQFFDLLPEMGPFSFQDVQGRQFALSFIGIEHFAERDLQIFRQISDLREKLQEPHA